MKFSDFVIKKQFLNKAVETIACIARGLCFLPLNSSTEILLKTLLKGKREFKRLLKNQAGVIPAFT